MLCSKPLLAPVQQQEEVSSVCILLHQNHLVSLLERCEEGDNMLMLQAAVQLDLPVDLEPVQLAPASKALGGWKPTRPRTDPGCAASPAYRFAML